MKKFCLILISVLFASSIANAQLKIGYVDSDAIMENLPDVQDVQKRLDALIQEWNEEISKKEKELRGKEADFENRKLIMSIAKQKESEKEIEELKTEISEYRQSKFGVKGDLFKQQEELMKPIQNLVFNAIKDVAEERELDFVFDRSGDIVFLYAKEEYDITPFVLEQLKWLYMKISVKDVADFVGGTVYGQANLQISNLARIDTAKENELTFLYRTSFQKHLSTTKASAIIISPEIEKTRENITYIVVENPAEALYKIILNYFNPDFSFDGIDSSASVDDNATLGKNVQIGKNVVIDNGVSIGENTTIYHNTVILKNVTIGKNCLIFPNVTIRENCVIGDNVIVHPGVVIGSDGFGYNTDKQGIIHKIPQIGNVIIEDDVELGSNTCIDRAALGSTIIRKGTKIDNLVQVAHNVEIGESTAISAQCGISGSSKVGSHVILAGQVGLADHIEVEDLTIVGAQAGLSKSVKKGKYFGTPAKEMGNFARLEGHVRNLPNYAKTIKALEKRIEELEKKLNN